MTKHSRPHIDAASGATTRVWFPNDWELEAIHAAAAAGDYLPWAGPDAPDEFHPPLRGQEYIPLRWPRRDHLKWKDDRDPARQVPHAQRAIDRAKAKAGFLAELQDWPTAEERVATFRRRAEEAHERDRRKAFEDVRAVRRRLRELPTDVRRATILAWNARPFPPDRVLPFIDRFLRGEVRPAHELLLPTQLLILGCTATRDPDPSRMPVSRRFISLTNRLARESLHGCGLSMRLLTAELGLLHPWESSRDGLLIGPTGPAMTAARAAELAANRSVDTELHRLPVGPEPRERPPFWRVLAGGGAHHQEVVRAWEARGVLRGAPVEYLPPRDAQQRDAICALFGIAPDPGPYSPPAQLELL